MRKKILNIIPFGDVYSTYYSVQVCDVGEYDVFKKMNYYRESYIFENIHGAKVGDIIFIDKYFNLSDLTDVHYVLKKIRKEDN